MGKNLICAIKVIHAMVISAKKLNNVNTYVSIKILISKTAQVPVHPLQKYKLNICKEII